MKFTEMPFVRTKNIDTQTKFGLWRIEEDEDQLLSNNPLCDYDKNFFEPIRAPLRRKQWLVARSLLKVMLNKDDIRIRYTEEGKPFLSTRDKEISIAHTENYVVAIVSDDVAAGIDIELIRPRILKVKDKFCSTEELDFCSGKDEIHYCTLIWCAKEALYKMHGRKNLDFIKNMSIDAFALSQSGDMLGKISEDGMSNKYRLSYEILDGIIIVWVVQNPE